MGISFMVKHENSFKFIFTLSAMFFFNCYVLDMVDEFMCNML